MILTSGPMEAESVLLCEIEEAVARDLGGLGPPIRVIVPSRSLRRHLLRVLATRFGAVVGVVVQTHRAAAMEVLERASVNLPAGGARLQDLLARRFAADEEILQRELGAFEDGFAPVAAVVRDLLDAGLERTTFDPILEALAGGVPNEEAEWAAAVVRVAAKCRGFADVTDSAHRGTLHEAAAEALSRFGPEVLPARRVLIHGFAEATGLLTDFLEALVRRTRATVILDHPPDPAASAERDPGWVFTRRLADRLAGPGSAAKGPTALESQHLIDIVAFTAPGTEAEVRETAERIAALLSDGAAPEGVGVVYRRLTPPVLAAVRRHFGRLGIPFSGEGAQIASGAAGRRAAAVVELLAQGVQSRVETWLAAEEGFTGLRTREADLALRSAGVARLAQAAALDASSMTAGGDITLPVVLSVGETGEGVTKKRRKMPAADLRAVVARAVALVEVLRRRPDHATAGDFLAWVREVLDRLTRQPRSDGENLLMRSIEALASELPAAFESGWAEFEPVLLRSLSDVGSLPAGGPGGGVQVLSVTETRGRTFDHLFLCGLNRAVFPARVGEDPVFSPGARRAVAQVLPDLPLKERDRPEERYLFAQLMAAAPAVTLSWQRVGSDGKEMNPSVFAERLRHAGRVWWARDQVSDEDVRNGAAPVENAPAVFGERPAGAVRPSCEHGVVEGLRGGRGTALVAAMTCAGVGTGTAHHLAAVLDELDPPGPASDLGPFLGAVGPRPTDTVWVTYLQAVAGCPWKAFLEKILGLDPPPEATFGAEGLQGAIAGSVVHEVLEKVSMHGGIERGKELAELRHRPARKVSWPKDAVLDRWIREEAEKKALENGSPALAPAVAEFVRTHLERARTLAWSKGAADVLGVESLGEAVIPWTTPGGEQRSTQVRFRADRVDPDAEGNALALLDFKTGRAPGGSVATAVRRGKLLQGVVYALGGGDGAVGRYVYLREETAPNKAVIEVNRELAAEGEDAVGAVLRSVNAGVFFPRMVSPGGGNGTTLCRWCSLKAACRYGDSGAVRRLETAFQATAGDEPPRELWNLPVRPVARRGKS